MRVRRCAAVVLMLSCAGTATAVAAAPGPRGNAKGIALARAKHTAYSKIGAELVTETGFVSMYAVEGKTSQFSWMWGNGRVPRGWSRATEHAIAALHKDRLVWWRDDLTPPPCTSPGICARIPVEVVIDRAGAFYAYGNADSHTCFGRLSGSQPVAYGDLWDVVTGRYFAPVRHGNTLVLTRTYPWDKTQTATSIEDVSSRTDLDLGGSLKVSRGGPGQPAFTVHYTNSQRSKAPKAPRIKLCG